jgi:hypothetical protein
LFHRFQNFHNCAHAEKLHALLALVTGLMGLWLVPAPYRMQFRDTAN